MNCSIIVYATISLDGGIDRVEGHVVLSSERDLYRLHYMRSIVDAVMVGANTVLKDDPLLTVRLPGYSGKQPYRIIVDSKLRTGLKHRVYDTRIAPSILITWEKYSGSKSIEDFINNGVEVVYAPRLGNGDLDLRAALKKVCERFRLRRILVEGGGYLIASLLEQRLVDAMYISISPRILGLNKVSLAGKELDREIRLKPVGFEVDHVSGEVLLIYRPIYG